MAEKLITRNFVLLFVANLLVASIFCLLFTTMAGFASQAYGSSESQSGLAASIFLVGGVMGRIVSGRYAEVVGLRRLNFIALAVMVVSALAYFAYDVGYGFLLVARLVHGVAYGVANTIIPALATKSMPIERVGEGTGYFMASAALAAGLGPMVGIVVADDVSYDALFALCAAAASIALAACLLARTPEGDKATKKKPGRFSIHDFFAPRAARFAFFMVLISLGYGAIMTFVNGYSAQLGFESFTPFMFLVHTVVLVATRPFTGKMIDRWGENSVLYPSIALHVAGLLLLAFANSGPAIVAVGVFTSLGFGTCVSAGQAVCVRLLGKEGSALAISTFFLLVDLGTGLSPYFWGLVIGVVGYAYMYLVAALVGVMALAYYHVQHGRHIKRNDK